MIDDTRAAAIANLATLIPVYLGPVWSHGHFTITMQPIPAQVPRASSFRQAVTDLWNACHSTEEWLESLQKAADAAGTVLTMANPTYLESGAVA